MANKYLIHGATYCGNGTASNEAASAGAAGAWNDINVFEGTPPAQGTLAAGDTVYIRSNTSAGANITRTLAASVTLGSANATTGAWITWVVDGGSVWSGVDGTLRYDCPSTYALTLRSYNRYLSQNYEKLAIYETNTNSNLKIIVVVPAWCEISNALIDCSANTNTYGNKILAPSTADCSVVFRKCHFKWARYNDGIIWVNGGTSNVALFDPHFELTVLESINSVLVIQNGYGARFEIYGGKITGAGATTGASIFKGGSYGGFAKAVGFQAPKTMLFYLNDAPVSNSVSSWAATGLDGGMGSVLCEKWGVADSRSDGYYPTLNAFLPDSSSTPWSWKVYPKAAGPSVAFGIATAKMFTDAAATKTITANLLVADSLSGVNKGTIWLQVSYIDDTTNGPVSISSFDTVGAALDTSTASWSATTYGAINLLKKQISVTTPSAIKQNTTVTVTLCGTAKSSSALDIFFFCPDVELS